MCNFFKYVYGDESKYSIFALVLGVSQLSALGVFPMVRKRLSRRKLYSGATALVVVGVSVVFCGAHEHALAGSGRRADLCRGRRLSRILMLMFLADSIEYGQWKLGKRNESITFSVQPFINKIGAAIANGVLGLTLIVSGINEAQSAAEVSTEGILTLKTSMLILPLIVILLGYIVYMKKFQN